MLKKLLAVTAFITLFLITNLLADKDIKMLDVKQQNLIAISAFTANGDLAKLEVAIADGLDSGLTINEIKEAMVHLYAYCGFPRSLNGIGILMQSVDKRAKDGIKDIKGKDASPIPDDYDADKFGANIRAKLAGLDKDISGTPWQEFSSEIDQFLKEHLFGDIFVRDVLDYKTRELVTISALAAMSGTESQLKFHLSAAMNMGLSIDALKDFIIVIDKRVDSNQAKIAQQVLNELEK